MPIRAPLKASLNLSPPSSSNPCSLPSQDSNGCSLYSLIHIQCMLIHALSTTASDVSSFKSKTAGAQVSFSQRLCFHCSGMWPGSQNALKLLHYIVHYIAEVENRSTQLIPKLARGSNISFICSPKRLRGHSV